MMKFVRVFAILTIAFLGAAYGDHEVYDAWFGEVGNGLITKGGPRVEVERAMKSIAIIDPYATGPGSWVYEFQVPAQVHLARARGHEVDGEAKAALKEYRVAQAFFDAARWPALATPERAAAYRQMLDCYFKVTQLMGVHVEVVRIPYEGKRIVGHLYKPEGPKAPVIVWSGGIDGWKTGGLDIKQRLMKEGFAVFAVDLPGTGESEWRLEATSERLYSRIADYLKTREDVDGTRIAAYFGSFSGAYAIKLALRDPDYKACVNHSGGVHAFFNPPVTELPPLTTSMGMRAFATITAMGMDRESVADVLTTFSTFSLQEQGYLQPAPNQHALLTIHGTKDQLMPVQEVELLTQSGVKQDALVYEGAGHMAWEFAGDHEPKMIAWLKDKLGM